MKALFLLVGICLGLSFSSNLLAQSRDSRYASKPIIVHKTVGFTKDPSRTWIDTNRHKKEGGEYEPQLFLWWAVDKSDSRKSVDGYDFYNTRLYFGFKDQDEFYELPDTFYAGTGNRYLSHALAYKDHVFYIAAYSLDESKKINLILYKFTKEKGLQAVLVNSSTSGMSYPALAFVGPERDGGNYYAVGEVLFPRLQFYDPVTNWFEKYFINPSFIGADGKLDATHISVKPEDLRDTGPEAVKNYAGFSYSTDLNSNPDYNHKAYLLGKNTIIARSPIANTFDRNGAKKLSTQLLKDSENDGWRFLDDRFNRNTTQLFLSYKTDQTDFKTDSKGNKYFKTWLRFGFKNDPEFYELPASYYLLFSEDMNSALYLDKEHVDSDHIAFKPPALMFSGETFYLFVPAYISDDNYDGIMFTYGIGKGLAKTVLFSGSTLGSGWFAYFMENEKNTFELRHVDPELNNIVATFQKGMEWLTTDADLNVDPWAIRRRYRVSARLFFQMPQMERYATPDIDRKVFTSSFNPVLHFSIFTTSLEDKTRLAELQKLKDYDVTDAVKHFTRAELLKLKDYDPDALNYIFTHYLTELPSYKSYFSGEALDKRTGFDEIPHTRIEVPFMPEVKDQATFPSCASYAFGALYKQFIDRDWQLTQLRKKDPGALRKETDISFFGMQQYLRGNKQGIDPANLWMYDTFERDRYSDNVQKSIPEFEFDSNGKGWKFPLEIVLQNENNLDKIASNVKEYFQRQFVEKGIPAQSLKDELGPIYAEFRRYFETLYANRKGKSASNSELSSEIKEINEMTGIPVKNIDLSAALAMPNIRAFYYSLFFSKSNEALHLRYPDVLEEVKIDSDKAATKLKIRDILNEGFPVLIRMNMNLVDPKDAWHFVLISGYKKVRDGRTGKFHDLFKIHNSWGKDWVYQTNDGWFMADHIVMGLGDSDTMFYISSLKALPDQYVESSAAYQKAFPGVYSDDDFYDRGLGATGANAIRDATILDDALHKKGSTLADVAAIYKKFFTDLGYEFVKQEELINRPNQYDSTTLTFKGIEIDVSRPECPHGNLIFFDDRVGLEAFKSKVDFSKVKGKFTETSSGRKEGNHIRYSSHENTCR